MKKYIVNWKVINWIYTATKENADLAWDKINIQATELPDNLTEKE
ncbi:MULTISPECIES: hypothetical protein [Flavobacterium]|nr:MULTISPECIES: hypothetical protein [Flavobacterium]